MSYIGGLNKNELAAFLANELNPFIKEIKALRQEVADLKSALGSQSKELYTIKDLTDLFGVTAATIHNWVHEGKLIKHKVGGRTHFKSSDVQKLIDLSKTTNEKNIK